MEGLVDVQDFMTELERKGLMIAPRDLVRYRLQERELERKRKQALNKKLLSFREIYDAKLFGSNISMDAIRLYAQKYAKPGEIIAYSNGNRKEYKIIIAAVIRLMKKRGYAPDSPDASEL